MRLPSEIEFAIPERIEVFNKIPVSGLYYYCGKEGTRQEDQFGVTGCEKDEEFSPGFRYFGPISFKTPGRPRKPQIPGLVLAKSFDGCLQWCLPDRNGKAFWPVDEDGIMGHTWNSDCCTKVE